MPNLQEQGIVTHDSQSTLLIQIHSPASCWQTPRSFPEFQTGPSCGLLRMQPREDSKAPAEKVFYRRFHAWSFFSAMLSRPMYHHQILASGVRSAQTPVKKRHIRVQKLRGILSFLMNHKNLLSSELRVNRGFRKDLTC